MADAGELDDPFKIRSAKRRRHALGIADSGSVRSAKARPFLRLNGSGGDNDADRGAEKKTVERFQESSGIDHNPKTERESGGTQPQ